MQCWVSGPGIPVTIFPAPPPNPEVRREYLRNSEPQVTARYAYVGLSPPGTGNSPWIAEEASVFGRGPLRCLLKLAVLKS